MSIPLLLCLLPSLAAGLAGPARGRERAQVHVRASYLDNVPECALSCLLGFATNSFPGCTNDDLPCQCTSESQSGFTLGEGALRCLVSSCKAQSRTTLEAFYRICSGIQGAQPLTHATITASMQDPSTFQLSNPAASTDAPSSTSSRRSTTRKSTTSHRSSHTQTSKPTTLRTSTTPPFTPTPGVAQSAGAATPQIAPLETGQIAGIVIAALVIVGIIVGIVLCVCYSRRKKARASIASFGLARKSSGHEGPTTPRMGGDLSPDEGPKPVAMLGIPSNPAQKRWTLWRMAMKKNQTHTAEGYAASTTERYGPPVFVGATHESSPMSVKSYQTTSQLLPDKPSLAVAPFPRHLAKKASERSLAERSLYGRPSTDMPDRKPVHFTPAPSQNMMHGALPSQGLRSMPSDPFLDENYAGGVMPGALSPRRASYRDLPRLQTGETSSASAANAARTQGMYPPGPYPLQTRQPPAPAAGGSMGQPASRFAQSHVSPQPSSSGNNGNEDVFALAIANRAAPSQFSKWAPLRPANQPPRTRPLTSLTNGSDTSFEDDGDTPPEAPGVVNTLSPVVESPAGVGIGVGVGGGSVPRYQQQQSQQQQPRGGPLVNGQQIFYPAIPGRGASRKQLRVTRPVERDEGDESPTRPHPPVRSQFRPRLEDARTARQPYGAPAPGSTHAPAPAPGAQSQAPTTAYRAYTPILGSGSARQNEFARNNEHLRNEPSRPPYQPQPPSQPSQSRSVELPDSSPPNRAMMRSDGRAPGQQQQPQVQQSPGSPNFSRPNLPQQQLFLRPDDPIHRGPFGGPASVAASASPAKFQIQSSPGLHGDTETWGGPIESRPIFRPAITQVPPKFPPPPFPLPPRQPQGLTQGLSQGLSQGIRGTWRGRYPPIGSQWRQ